MRHSANRGAFIGPGRLGPDINLKVIGRSDFKYNGRNKSCESSICIFLIVGDSYIDRSASMVEIEVELYL